MVMVTVLIVLFLVLPFRHVSLLLLLGAMKSLFVLMLTLLAVLPVRLDLLVVLLPLMIIPFQARPLLMELK